MTMISDVQAATLSEIGSDQAPFDGAAVIASLLKRASLGESEENNTRKP